MSFDANIVEGTLQSATEEKQNVPIKGDKAFKERFAKMAAPLQQKVGAVVVFLPSQGTVLDIGCADGPITETLASLCPQNSFIGIDNEPTAIEKAKLRDPKDNLSFRVADASEDIFEKESIDGIVLCSTAHELATYMKGGVAGLWKVLDQGVGALKNKGRVIIRDFVVPQYGTGEVILRVPSNDGIFSGPTNELATGAMLRKFLKEFNSSFYENGVVPFRDLKNDDEYTSVKLALRDAAEFLLKKDYRTNWDHEVTEQFLHFSQEESVLQFLKRGLRVLLAREIHNPWIKQHSFDGKVYLYNESGEQIATPPTNFIIAGEKTDKGILIEEVNNRELTNPQWNSIEYFKDLKTEQVWELATRKHNRIHILPWFIDEAGGIKVIVCDSYPRPIINAKSDSPNLDRSFCSGYLMELPYEVVRIKQDSTELTKAFLSQRKFHKRTISSPTRHLTSPVDLGEVITLVSAEIDPVPEFLSGIKGTKSGWSESGTYRSISAQQVLRSTHMGAISEPEMERAVYRLLLDQGLSVGPWIGAEVNLSDGMVFNAHPVSYLSEISSKHVVFERCDSGLSPKYQSVVSGTFYELNKDLNLLQRKELEYISPRNLSNNKILVVPLKKNRNGEIYVGLERRALPSTHEIFNETYAFSLPEYRLSKSVTDIYEGCKEVAEKIKDNFMFDPKKFIPLGEKYWSSPAISPEAMYPFAVDVGEESTKDLFWIPLRDVMNAHSNIRNGHTITGIFRAAHATGILS